MSGQTWSEFRLEAFGEPYMVWHDGPDFTQFASNWAADPVDVERMLRAGLAEQDPLAAEAVGELRLSPVAAAAFTSLLEEAIRTAPGTFRVRVAESLHRLTGSEHWSTEVVSVLLGRDFWSTRLDAAMALAHFAPTIELIAALMRGVQDEEYLVRYHSSNTLLGYAGKAPDVASDAEVFAQITSDATPEQWALAASGLAGAASARLSAR